MDDVLHCTDHGRGFIVDVRRHRCPCGYWKLSGVPCLRGIATLSYMRYDIKGYVDNWYSAELAKKAYTKDVPPLPGREDWADVEGLPVLPPPHKVMPGRPKKKGTGGSTDQSRTGVGTMMRKMGAVMHCSRCGQSDHNVRGCKMTAEEVAALPPPPPPRPVGRPRRRPLEAQQLHEDTVQRGSTRSDWDKHTTTVVEREIRQTMRGVGVHVSSETGNQYFASGAGVRLEEVDINPDVINQSQQPGTQPPNTQPRST
ncbi:hypothetical protein LINPERPRIM_LOCUS2191 [Linum perenne]